jgi:hypothetical protein
MKHLRDVDGFLE